MKIFFLYILIPIVFFTFLNCTAQQREYDTIPIKYGRQYIRTFVPNAIREKAVSIEGYLPKNYVKDGSIDYTKNIQVALNENDVVLFPSGIFSINGISVHSNSILVFEENAELKMIPNKLERYEIISIVGVDNVTFYNPKIIGDLRERTVHNGEWGYGIDIRGSQNIKIFSPNISNTFGDGIVISRSRKGLANKSLKLYDTKNILIDKAYIDYAGRNGISIIGVDGLKICSSTILNTFTKKPKAAIDIEPDNNSYVVNNITIDSLFTFNNVDGILFVLRKQASTKERMTVNIQINNHKDLGSSYPMNFSSYSDNKELKALEGEIKINNPVWIDNKYSMVRSESYGLSPKILITKPSLRALRLKKWKGDNVSNYLHEQQVKMHVKDTVNFRIKFK